MEKQSKKTLHDKDIKIDLPVTLDDMNELLAIKAEEKNLKLTCTIEHNVPSFLSCDPGRLRQILMNLIGNAIKLSIKVKLPTGNP